MGKFKHRKRKEYETDLDYYYNTQGNVKAMIQVCYKAHRKNDEIIKGDIEVNNTHDDRNFKVRFDEKWSEVFFHAFGKNNSYVINHYNDIGLIIESDTSYYKGHFQKAKYYYNEQNKSSLIEYYDIDNQLTQKHTLTYDEFGREIGEFNSNIINGEEKKVQTSKRAYDERGNQILVEQYDYNGVLRYRTNWFFDENNNKIEDRSEYFEENMKSSSRITRYQYNSYGHCIQSTYYSLDEQYLDTHYYNYKYDEQGNLIIEKNTFEDEDAAETEEIENDERGNWIVKKTFHNKIPINVFTRTIVYFDEEVDKNEWIHPLENEDAVVVVRNTEEDNEEEQIDIADVKWLVESNGGLARIFPVQRYYVYKFKKLPSLVFFNSVYIEAIGLCEQLKENMNAVEIHTYINNGNYGEEKQNYTLEFKYQPGYLLQVTSISGEDEDEFNIPDFISDRYDEHVYFGVVELYRPAEKSNYRDRFFEEELDRFIAKCTLTKKPDKPVIKIIEVKGGNFTTKERAVDDNFEIRDLDVNYGYGFEKFHNELMDRFHTSTKGLVLFHGLPGTGKTYYIRHLLRKMATNNKVVIYMPPNMVDHLVDPGFMTFLADEIKDWSNEGKFCVLLIEDAEPLLAKRQEGVRIQGVTNLLNMTDGLLNDMLNLQIICTFNVDLRKLDSALLRPGRLIARKEFKALSELDANLLAQRLGIKHHFKKPATLSEIYAMRKNQNTLIHDVDSDHNSSTLIDDLI